MNRLYSVLFFLILAILTGCSEVENASDLQVSLTIPTALEDSGIIHGVLLNSNAKDPVKGTLYLSRNLSAGSPNIPPTISFSLQSDPRAKYNSLTGEFFFQDIIPGDSYVFVLHYGPGKILVVREDFSGYPIMIDVEAGKSTDLGTIFVTEP
jgi:hypothetical protein